MEIRRFLYKNFFYILKNSKTKFFIFYLNVRDNPQEGAWLISSNYFYLSVFFFFFLIGNKSIIKKTIKLK